MNQPHAGVPDFLLLILRKGNHNRRELCEAKETAAVMDQCITERPIVVGCDSNPGATMVRTDAPIGRIQL